jgi:hypothetical protein
MLSAEHNNFTYILIDILIISDNYQMIITPSMVNHGPLFSELFIWTLDPVFLITMTQIPFYKKKVPCHCVQS